MAASASDVLGDKDTQTAILAQRRCIILAIVGATPSSNSSVALILQAGFLSSVKSWLDDILSGSVGELENSRSANFDQLLVLIRYSSLVSVLFLVLFRFQVGLIYFYIC